MSLDLLKSSEPTIRKGSLRAVALVVSCCIPLVLAGALAPTALGDEPPANDLCKDARPIEQGQHVFTTLGAGTDGPVTSSCSTFGNMVTWNDVWFSYTAESDGILRLSTCNLIDFDSRISLYGGSCPENSGGEDAGGSLVEIGCNDDAPGCAGYSSQVVIACTEGQAILVRIGGFAEGASGSGSFDLSIDPPCFEGCSEVSQLELEPCGMGTNDGCNSAAYTADSDLSFFHETLSIDVPLCGTWFCDGSIRDTDWFMFTIPEPGAMISVNLQSTDLVVGYLYLARTGCPLEIIDYKYGVCGTNIPEQWLIPGEYRAIVAPGFESLAQCGPDGFSGKYELLVSELEHEVPFPENDDCANATPIGDGAHPFTNFYSTTDGSDQSPPECSEYGTIIQADVWFAYEATCSGDVTASLCDTADFDTRLEVWTEGCDGSMLACNDDGEQCSAYTSEVGFEATCGTTYLIRVAGYQGARGQGILNLECVGGCCPADFDGDGRVGGSDLAALLGGWNSSDPDLDLTGDGVADGADLASLLGVWGDC